MNAPRSIALAALMTLAGCLREDPDPVDVVTVDVDASFAADTPERLTGVVSIELALPDGEPSRELILAGLHLGGRSIGAESIRGLQSFPRDLAGGDVVRVDLAIDLDVGVGWIEVPVPGCGLTLELPVEVAVHDVGASEAGQDGIVLATSAAILTTPEETQFPLATRRVWDLGTLVDVLAADPSRDDDLLVSTLARVERVGLDGTRRWSTDLAALGVMGLARGGGVDAFLASVEDDSMGCSVPEGAESSSVAVGRLDDAGDLAWCIRLPSDFARIAVTDGGTIAVAMLEEQGTLGTRLLRFAPDGTSLGSLWAAAPPGTMVSIGERLVVGGTDPSTYFTDIAVVDGDHVEVLPLDQPFYDLLERADGTLGLLTGASGVDRARWIVDLDTLRVLDAEPLTGELGGPVTFVELGDGSLFGLGDAWTGDESQPILGYELHRNDALRAWGALTCEPARIHRIHGAGAAPIVAFDATGLSLGETDVASPGPLRTLVVELAVP